MAHDFDSENEPEYPFGIQDDQQRSIEELIKNQEDSSFEDFLNARSGGKDWKNETPQEDAGNVAAISEPSIPSNPIPGQSFGRGAAPVVAEPSVTALAMQDPNYIERGHRVEPVHPIVTSIAEPEVSENTAVAQTTNENRTVLAIRSHEITGQYLVETTEASEMDAQGLKVFLDVKKIGVTEMTPEQVIERINLLYQDIEDRKNHIRGLRSALEEHLLKANSSRRAEIHAKSQQLRKARTKPQDGEAKKSSKPKISLKGKTPAMKSIDVLKKLGMSRSEVLSQIEKKGQLDDQAKAYIETLTFDE